MQVSAKFGEKRCEVDAHRCALAQVQANADLCAERGVMCLSSNAHMRSLDRKDLAIRWSCGADLKIAVSRQSLWCCWVKFARNVHADRCRRIHRNVPKMHAQCSLGLRRKYHDAIIDENGETAAHSDCGVVRG
jgi:hypothetical protein